MRTEPDAFEESISSTLRAAAPKEVPLALELHAAGIPLDLPPDRTMRRVLSVLGAPVAFVIVMVAVSLGLARISWSGLVSVGQSVHPIMAETTFATMTASDFAIRVNGRAFSPPESLSVDIDGGDTAFRLLRLAWQTEGRRVELVMQFAGDASHWWISELAASVGGPAPGWAYFVGPFFQTPLGMDYQGSLDLSSDRSLGAAASLHLADVRMSVPGAATARHSLTRGPVPEAARMPDGHINPALVPDFISVTDHADGIAGYAPKELVLGQPILSTSPQPQPLDTPVYGDDLATLVGHMIPDRGFVPLTPGS